MIVTQANQITTRAKIFTLVIVYFSMNSNVHKKAPISIAQKNIFWFFLGAILIISCRRFIITSADLNDYRYMKENPELFSKEAIESVRDYLISTNCLSPHAEVQFGFI